MSDNIPDNLPEDDSEKKKAIINLSSADGTDVSGVVRDAGNRELAGLAKAEALGGKIREYINGESAGKSAEELKNDLKMSNEDLKAVADFKEGYERASKGDTDFTKPEDQEEGASGLSK